MAYISGIRKLLGSVALSAALYGADMNFVDQASKSVQKVEALAPRLVKICQTEVVYSFENLPSDIAGVITGAKLSRYPELHFGYPLGKTRNYNRLKIRRYLFYEVMIRITAAYRER